MASPKHVLIAGAGIAGPALALLLTRAGHKCTVVERAPKIRATGQQIDVSGEGLKVLKHLGIDEEVRRSTVHDDGMKFVHEDDSLIAAFPVEKTGGSQSLVKEIEIMRSDLVRILYQRTKQQVEYIFDDQITDLTQISDGIVVKFSSGRVPRTYHLVVAADGLRSRTRDLAFPSTNTEIVRLKQYVGFFNLPHQDSDSTWSRWFNSTKGRTVCLRPNKENGSTSAYITQVTDDSDAVANLSIDEQVQEILRRFSDVGWETDRVLEHLQRKNGEGFYLQESAQAKSSSWVQDMVVLLGDAGYCPSPLSGQGTTAALVGAYILAGCIATYSDHDEALKQYEKQMRPFVENMQNLPPGVPWIANPQSALGIKIFNNALRVAGFAINYGIASALGKIGELLPAGKCEILPEFPALAQQ